MKTTNFFLTLALLVSTVAFSQVGIGTTTPDASSILDVESTTKGFLPPRTTPGAITNPTEGLVIYNTDINCLQWYNGSGWYNACDGTTTVITVIGANGLEWMDRNLGANQVATSSTDAAAYGDLFQWGRAADGHEKIFRVTGDDPTSVSYEDVKDTDGVANFNSPGGAWDGKFIRRATGNTDYNWVDPSVSGVNDLWQGVNGTNNPCPIGFRLPTGPELNSERQSWSSNNAAGAFASPLKLPVAGSRARNSTNLGNVGSSGRYWTSNVGATARRLRFESSNALMESTVRSVGNSVRCLKD